LIRHVLLLAMVVGIFAGVRSFAPDGAPIGTGAILALGAILLGAVHAGRIANALGLPSLTGYVLFGLVIGPDAVGLVTGDMLADLSVAKRIAVGLIGILAGLEVDLGAMRPRLREVATVLAAGIGTSAVGSFLAALTVASLVWPTSDYAFADRVLVAIVCATATIAVSPPVVMGVLAEVRAKGPTTDLWIAVAVLADLVIVLSFAVVGTLVGRRFPNPGEATGVLLAAGHLVMSMVLGAALGGILHLYVARGLKRVGLFVFALLVVVAEAFVPLHADPLIVGLGAGVMLQAIGAERALFADEIQPSALPTFAVFFAVVGAEIDLPQFIRVAPFALFLAVVRGAGFFIGAHGVGSLIGLPPTTRRLAPWGMLPQAGIALALADAVSHTFRPWGEVYGTLLVGVVVINELVGPVLFRRAVLSSGEAGHRQATKLDAAAHVPEPEPA
jgi:Kef-type K+ transport system membrane component KefB